MRDRRTIALLLYATLVLTVSSIPGAVISEAGLSSSDVLYHFASYLLMGVIAHAALHRWERALAYGGAVALVDELHQYFIPGRTVSAIDLGLNSGGLTAGILMYFLINWWKERYGIPGNG